MDLVIKLQVVDGFQIFLIAYFLLIMLSKGNEKKGSILIWRRKCNQAENKTSCALLAHVMPSKY